MASGPRSPAPRPLTIRTLFAAPAAVAVVNAMPVVTTAMPIVADSARCNFNKNRYDATIGYQYTTPAESKYNVTVVTGQYDGYADFPDKPNPTAITNAIIGSQLVHIPSMLAPLSSVPASNITVRTNAKGGVTTSYLVPTKTLPLVALNPKLAPQEAALRTTIDAAYNRPPKDAAAAGTGASGTPAPAAQPVRALLATLAGAVKAAAGNAKAAAATRSASRGR